MFFSCADEINVTTCRLVVHDLAQLWALPNCQIVRMRLHLLDESIHSIWAPNIFLVILIIAQHHKHSLQLLIESRLDPCSSTGETDFQKSSHLEGSNLFGDGHLGWMHHRHLLRCWAGCQSELAFGWRGRCPSAEPEVASCQLIFWDKLTGQTAQTCRCLCTLTQAAHILEPTCLLAHMTLIVRSLPFQCQRLVARTII